MSDLEKDPIINAIHKGIKAGIEATLDGGHLASCVILIYSGMDTMGYLDMPAGQQDVTRADFIRWAENYIKFPCKDQLTGADLYGARCAMLHQYGVVSRMSREGQCRMIGYMDKSVPEIRYNASVHPDTVMVSVPALKEAFFTGIDKFLINAFAGKEKAAVVEERMKSLVQCLPYRK